MKRNVLCIACCAVVLLCSMHLVAQVKGNPKLDAPPKGQPSQDKSGSKLSKELRTLYENVSSKDNRALKAKPVQPDQELGKYIQIHGDRVLVDITIKGDKNAARSELEKIGVKVTATFGRVISGSIPIGSLPKLETATNVRYVRPAYQPLHQSKPLNNAPGTAFIKNKVMPVISQGDTAQGSYLARMAGRKKKKIDGSGVKVGILSDSYDNLGGAADGVAGGELPGKGNPLNYTKPVKVLLDQDGGGTDEGRAMAEIVHDVAPGSELFFNSASFGQAAFAQGILDLQKQGCRVIVDDLLYFAEPFFQDGIIAQAVDMVKKKGTAYFSAAGNSSIRSYESEYRTSSFAPFGSDYGTAHNFSGAGDAPRYFQPIFIPTNGTFIVSFQWDEPFFSAGGEGTRSDLDMYLLDNEGTVVAAGSTDNIKSGDPLELFGYANTTDNNTFYLLILKFSGPDPSNLKYILFRDGAFYLTDPPIPGILAPTIIGHAKAEGAISTGAAFYGSTPAYGVDTPVVEFFSSVGGVANYFDAVGNRIAPLVRKKPDITAPDGGNTSFFDPFGNGDIAEDADHFPNFFGTSAAAPHAAGVAALMIDAQKIKTITPSQIRGVLASNTYDMDNVYTTGFDKGFDFNTGAGLIKANDAVKQVSFPKVFVKNLDLRAVCSDDPSKILNWKIINPNPFEVETQWLVVGSRQHAKITAQPGETGFSTTTLYYRNKPVNNIVIAEWEDNFRFPRFDIAAGSKAICGKEKLTQMDNREIKEDVAIETASPQLVTAEVYPNPSSKYFRVYLSLPDRQNTELTLFGIDGRQLFKKSVKSQGIVDIDASNYKSGVYILKVHQGEFNKTIKLIRM